MTQTSLSKSLYDQDFALWLEQVANQLRVGDFSHLDIDNLVVELDALGRSQKREIKSRLVVLLAHLLKCLYIDSAYDNRGWEVTLREQRRELRLLLEQSPSLVHYAADVVEDAYTIALSEVREDYAKVPFPDHWPFSSALDDLLTCPFWQ
ncbi:hypothetical protein GFS31_13870 [Leptolyngbya sp. BL0902]|uniref:DUF29 domain-containing protein n=1 Tax=Leptolyngbya sp. BL0902 TaxID=1115757 RepID=UPI0018E7B38B|nr:DUF29 domain-containing protein [Leptolyngbya sp. BL0902]QQE64706.1 hypothetical protein GFS31_13870 [Leptolyngbya sp. BL0902]